MPRRSMVALAVTAALGVVAFSSSAFTQQIKSGSTGGGVYSKNTPPPKPKPEPKPAPKPQPTWSGGAAGGIVSEGQGYGMTKKPGLRDR